MRRAVAAMPFLLAMACASSHPTGERYPSCNPGNRCPLEGYRCLPTVTMGMRCLPPCTDGCLPSELCLAIGSVAACVPPGHVGPGELCENEADCVAGYVCLSGNILNDLLPPEYQFRVPFNDPPRCRPRCDHPGSIPDGGVPVHTCPDGWFCNAWTGYGADSLSNACIQLCDPATGAGCHDDELCYCSSSCVSAAAQVADCLYGCPLGTFCTTTCDTPEQVAAYCPPR